jgi:CBS domain-containing protein
MLVRQIMSRPPVVSEDTPLTEVARAMLDRGSTTAEVVDADGRLVGVIREDDFAPRAHHVALTTLCIPEVFGEPVWGDELEEVYVRGARGRRARHVMHPSSLQVREDMPVFEAVQRLVDTGAAFLPVVRDGRPVGMLTRLDLARLLVWEGVEE